MIGYVNQKILDIEVAKYIFIAITALKIFTFALFKNYGVDFLGPPIDANTYHDIATGVFFWPHPWAIFLKLMYDHGIYSRFGITVLIFGINCTMVPWLIAKILCGKNRCMSTLNWHLLSMVALYPTMTIFSSDIYRDTPMILCFLIFVYCAGYYMNQPSSDWKFLGGAWSLALLIITGYIIFKLRAYLAVSMIVAMILVCVLNRPLKLWQYAICYLLGLTAANWIGIFDYLKGEYRQGYAGAGSAYQLDFSQGIFLLNYFESFVYNIFGFYVYNALSLIVFVIESIPMLILCAYIYTHRKFVNKFSKFLVVFFFIYAVWVIGADALGTAVRYRMFHFLTIVLVAGLVGQNIMAKIKKTSL